MPARTAVPDGTARTRTDAATRHEAIRSRGPRRGVAIAAALLVTVVVVLAAALTRPAPVLASCAALPPDPAEAVFLGDVVFVGTVLRTENDGRWATVRVEERWKGSRDLAETVEVRGGPEPGTATSIDRAFLPGRYLFVVQRDGTGLRDNACSGTVRWSEDLAGLRPAGVPAASAELPTDPVGSIDWTTVGLVAALLVALLVSLVAYLWVLRARRRPPDWIR